MQMAHMPCLTGIPQVRTEATGHLKPHFHSYCPMSDTQDFLIGLVSLPETRISKRPPLLSLAFQPHPPIPVWVFNSASSPLWPQLKVPRKLPCLCSCLTLYLRKPTKAGLNGNESFGCHFCEVFLAFHLSVSSPALETLEMEPTALHMVLYR